MKSKYRSALSRHLKVIAQSGVEGEDYASSYEEFDDLFEQLEEAADAGVVSETQRDAIQAVFDCMIRVNDELNKGLLGYDIFDDESYRDSPIWEPTREAARAAIKALKSEEDRAT